MIIFFQQSKDNNIVYFEEKMKKYITFKIGKKIVAVPSSEEWSLNPTLINKSFINENGDEYIAFKRESVPVYDTGNLLFGEPMKKFDGLLFIDKDGSRIALKTESFFDEEVEFDVEVDVEDLFLI